MHILIPVANFELVEMWRAAKLGAARSVHSNLLPVSAGQAPTKHLAKKIGGSFLVHFLTLSNIEEEDHGPLGRVGVLVLVGCYLTYHKVMR